MQCEVFAGSVKVPGLKVDDASAYFAEVRQLLDLLILEEWSIYLHDYGKPDNRYNLVQPKTIIIVLEKIREADRKNVFSVLKKSERDKKKLWVRIIIMAYFDRITSTLSLSLPVKLSFTA